MIAKTLSCLALAALIPLATTRSAPVESASDQHGLIGIPTERSDGSHTKHPDAQWYPDAGFGLFIHWGISSVRKMNISWPMIPGRALKNKKLSPEEIQRVVREGDYNLNGKPPEITPNEYWSMAKDFNPKNYDPEKWIKAAKDAGFAYAVLTTRHHEGFALWPSAYGDFNTKNFMDGRDLVKPFVEACRKNGLKVGLYYSPPDWHFDRDSMSFLYHGARKSNPKLPELGPDLKPRTKKPSAAELAKHHADYDAMVRGQIEELLTRYGKIDLLWFDGCQPTPNGKNSITQARIRQLQPGIIMNPRLHGKGDFITYERDLKTNKVAKGWAEFCNTWGLLWTYQEREFRSNAFILGQLAKSRSLGINYLLGIGPDGNGELHPNAYKNMEVVAGWMKNNAVAVHAVRPLPKEESASAPATAVGATRFLFNIPRFRPGASNSGPFEADKLPAEDATLTLRGIPEAPVQAKLLGDGKPLECEFSSGTATVKLPASRQSGLVDVVHLSFSRKTP